MSAKPQNSCPVCSDPMPEPKRTGRPRHYCSRVCSERARSRIRQAAALREHAARVEEHVGNPAYGSPEHLGSRATDFRARARTLVDRLHTN